MNDLYQTYEANSGMVARDLDAKDILLPISHSTQKAQIEITLDLQGMFLTAEKIPKDKSVTIIPVTEDSAARSSNPCAHPLEDKLEYLAGDYEKYTGVDNKKKHQLYLSQLSAWHNSEYSCPQIEAIYTYILKMCVMEDLVKSGILKCSQETGLLTTDKIEGIPQKECFVRFSVDTGVAGKTDQIYRDKEIFDAYVTYYQNCRSDKDLCCISGELVVCSEKHGAKIRNAGDKAKLISANDSSGFTYRGRLSDSWQVASIGYEVSQKAHSALRWLIQRQGFRIGEMSVVAWEITGKKIPDISKSTIDAIEGLLNDDYETMDGFTNDVYARKLKLAVHGYEQELCNNTQVVVLGVEAATTGRLSICFYHKMSGSNFLDNICYWYSSCFWNQLIQDKEDKHHWFWCAGAPSLYSIAVTAFGSRNEKLTKSTIERLLPCIIDKKNLPPDIVKAAVSRVSNPNSFDSKAAHKQAVGVTCALIRKFRYDKTEKKEDWNMALDKTEKDRSYVFGRLLGAARKLEEEALSYDAKESRRATAAERYFQQFERRPAQTWKVIDNSLMPYKLRLKSMGKTYYEKELQEIYDLLQKDDFVSKERLSELYLLGYNCQLNSYKMEEK